MRGSYLLILLSLIISLNNFAQQSKIKYTPPNPAFEEYIKKRMNDKGQLLRTVDTDLGYVPEPFLIGESENNINSISDYLPRQYDLRNQNYITSVKNQGSAPACWAFAALGAIESLLKMLDYGEFDLSEKNLFYGHEFINPVRGNSSIATSYFIRGDGPILESDDPFVYPSSKIQRKFVIPFYISEYSIALGHLSIKQALYNYGAAEISFSWEPRYYDYKTKVYFKDNKIWSEKTGHAVVLVGWDDDKDTRGGKGAWIVKNSWGTGFGEYGFFYLSYHDSSFARYQRSSFWPTLEKLNRNMTIHQYDFLGFTSAVGFEKSEAYGLIKFKIPKKQKITRLGTWINIGNSTVSFEIFDSFDGFVLSNKIGETGELTSIYCGYRTFDLTTPIEIEKDQDVYIKVRYNTPSYNYPMSIEIAVKNYSDPVIETEKCWISDSGLNGSWIRVGNDTENKFDLCIKAYSEYSSSPIKDNNILLSQNYPNPFNDKTTIFINPPKDEKTTLEIFNSIGERITVDDVTNVYKYEWVPRVSSGIYFYRVSTQTRFETLKMVYVK